MQFHRCGDEWCLAQQIPLPRAWIALFRNPGDDYSHLTKTHHGRQWRPQYLSDVESTLKALANPVLRTKDLPLLDQRHDSWMIEYQPEGYQEFHAHGRGLITQVVYLDADTSQTEVQIGADIKVWCSRPGLVLTMSGATKHRATPVAHKKRVIVVDWSSP